MARNPELARLESGPGPPCGSAARRRSWRAVAATAWLAAGGRSSDPQRPGFALTVDRRPGLGQDRGRADADAATIEPGALDTPAERQSTRDRPLRTRKDDDRDCAYRRGYRARGLRNRARGPSAGSGPASATTRSTGPARRPASARSRSSASSPSSRTTCAPTTSSTAASAGPCRTGERATSTTRTPPAAPSTTSPSRTRCTTPSWRRGYGPWWSWPSRRVRSFPTTRSSASGSSRARRSGARTRPASGRSLPRTTGMGRARPRAGRALRGPLRRDARPRVAVELWNEPDISYWRGTPEEFYALYDVTAAAVKAALPDAAVGGPATTGDLGPGRGAMSSSEASSPTARGPAAPLDFVAFHTKGARFVPWRVYGPLGGPAPDAAVPSSLKMLREVRAALDAVAAHPKIPRPAVHRRRVRRLGAGALGRLRQRELRLPQHRAYFPVFQCKLMKKLLTRATGAGRHVDQATTWSFYFEGERFFEGTRSLFTAQGVEKPVLNAYRMLAPDGRRPSGGRFEPCLAARTSRRRRGRHAGGDRRARHVQWARLRDRAGVAARRRPVSRGHARDRRHAAHRASAVRGQPHPPPPLAHRRPAQQQPHRLDDAGGPQDPSDAQLRAIKDRAGPRAAGARARGGDPGRLARLEDSVSPAERVA